MLYDSAVVDDDLHLSEVELKKNWGGATFQIWVVYFKKLKPMMEYVNCEPEMHVVDLFGCGSMQW